MKKITFSILAMLLLGCQAEPEPENNSCDCQGETVRVADKYVGIVYFDDFYDYGISLDYVGGIIGVKPCKDIDSAYLFEGSQLIVSGSIKTPCYFGSQPSTTSRPSGYSPIEVTFIEPYIETQENQ